MKKITLFLISILVCMSSVAQNVTWQEIMKKDWILSDSNHSFELHLTHNANGSVDALYIIGILPGLPPKRLVGKVQQANNDAVYLDLLSDDASRSSSWGLIGNLTYWDHQVWTLEMQLTTTQYGSATTSKNIKVFLYDYAAEKEAEEKEAAEKERRKKQEEDSLRLAKERYLKSPEYKVKAKFEQLVSSEQIAYVKKKSFNIGAALNSDYANAIDSKSELSVVNADGEVKQIVFGIPTTLTLKDKSKISVEYIGSCEFKNTTTNADVKAYYNEDLSNVIYCVSTMNQQLAFLMYNETLLKFSKSAAKTAFMR